MEKLLDYAKPIGFVAVILLFLAFGIFSGVKEEQRVADIESDIASLQSDYINLAKEAESQRVSCIRVTLNEAEMAAIHRRANILRTELSTYAKKE